MELKNITKVLFPFHCNFVSFLSFGMCNKGDLSIIKLRKISHLQLKSCSAHLICKSRKYDILILLIIIATCLSTRSSILFLLLQNENHTVQSVLSPHPWRMAGWRLDTGWLLNYVESRLKNYGLNITWKIIFSFIWVVLLSETIWHTWKTIKQGCWL